MEDFEIIYAYSRADAIADGVLIDVTDLAKEAGFRYPVAMTSTAWRECVEVDQQLSNQDERGRLWTTVGCSHSSAICDRPFQRGVHDLLQGARR